jgi:5'-3' exonuclease
MSRRIASEKHRKAVSCILGDLSKLKAEEAVQIPLSSLNGLKMQNLRSALNRVTRDKNIPVVTSSDDKDMYVWRADSSKTTGANE